MEEIYFSMIVYVDDEELMKRSLDSILDTTTRVQGKIKLIVSDPIVSQETRLVFEEAVNGLEQNQYVYIPVKDANIGEAYNQAIEYTEGRYVNFSLASTYFEPKTLDFIYTMAEELERPKLMALEPWTVNEKDEYVQYKMSPKAGKDGYSRISLHDNPENCHHYPYGRKNQCQSPYYIYTTGIDLLFLM